MDRLIYILCSFLFLFTSCGEQAEAEQTVNGELVEVTRTIQVSVLPMTPVGTPATRTDSDRPEKGESLHVCLGSDAVTRAKGGETESTTDEAKITNAFILQFAGTAPGSVLKKKITLTEAQLRGGQPIACNFVMTAGVKNRVYVVANCSKTLTENSTTLSSFESYTSLGVSTSVPTIGLPMSACQDIGVGDGFETFQVKSVLAKLKFTTTTGSLTLKGLPAGYSFYTQATAGEAAFRPAGMTYTSTATLTSGTTYYVPENLSGRVSLSSSVARCSLFAPANSMYMQIAANSTTYNVYIGDGSASDFNVSGNHAYHFIANILGASDMDLRVGTPSVTDLSATGTANCYIATSANKWYSFNGTVMGNGATTPVPANLMSGTIAAPIVPSKLSPVNGDVLWETVNTTTAPAVGSVVAASYVVNGTVLFRTGGQQGNAVIAALDASNNILWSWHIWRINSDPTASTFTFPAYTSTSGTFDDTGTTSHAGLTMMTYNLGALSNTAKNNLSTGLHYQWGRKDPFPGYAGLSSPDNVVMGTVPSGVPVIPGSTAQYTVAQSVASPTIFFKYGGDWTSRNDNLWGTAMTGTVTISNGSSNNYNSNAGIKSIYDPCPVGWRVPPGYVYAILSTSTFGWDTSGRSYTSVWFPASGYRIGSNGSLLSIGANGYYWTSTPGAAGTSYGSDLYFSNSGVYPYSSDYRANGDCVRCSRE